MYGLSRSGLKELLEAEGFYKLESNSENIVRERGGVLNEASLPIIQEFMESKLKSLSTLGLDFEFEGEGISTSVIALKDTYYRQFHLIINDNQLGHLEILPKTVLSDTRDTSYVPFKNGVVKIKASGIEVISYESLGNSYVWKKQVIPREFHNDINRHECEFVKFLMNVTEENGKRFDAFKSALGYLMHAYSHPSRGQAVILYDQTITDVNQPQGGTGKGIIVNAVNQIRKVTTIDGKRFDPKDKFNFQTVQPLTQVVSLDDVRKNFDFSVLYSCLTDGLTVERKNQGSFLIPAAQSPNFILSSNSILDTDGTSSTRRQFVLELSPYYSQRIKSGTEEPIIEEHGGYFFSEESWDEKEWNIFYAFMVECIRFYLQNGLVGYDTINVASNRLAQTTSGDFHHWVEEKGLELNIKYETKAMFEEFKLTHLGDDSTFTQHKFTKWLKSFAASKNWKHQSSRSNNTSYFHFSVA